MPVRSVGMDEIPPAGGFITRQHVYTLADYTAGGTTAPAVGDLVILSTAGNSYVKRAGDNANGSAGLGRVTAVNTTDGTVQVEWFNIRAFVKLATDDLNTVTLGNSVIKDGDTTVASNVDAEATTGPLIAVHRSGTSGAGYVLAALVV